MFWNILIAVCVGVVIGFALVTVWSGYMAILSERERHRRQAEEMEKYFESANAAHSSRSEGSSPR